MTEQIVLKFVKNVGKVCQQGLYRFLDAKFKTFFREFLQTQGYQMTKERSLEPKPLDKRRNQGFPTMQRKLTITT